MGDRVSIQFKDKYGDLSPYLYSHWGGMAVVEAAKGFVDTIHDDEEAGFALVLFIQSEFAKPFDDFDLEFRGDGDNDDNGNHEIDIRTGQSSRTKPRKEATKDEIKEARDRAHSLVTTTIQKLDLINRDLKNNLESFDKT